jgi:hypothetical protein
MPKVIEVISEADLQGAVTDLATWLGIWWWHDIDPRRNKAGWPDLYLLGKNGELYRELKNATRKPTPEQAALGERMTIAGVNWALWRPADWRSGRIRHELEEIR